MNRTGEIMRKLFRKYGLDIKSFHAGGYLSPSMCFPNEVNAVEIRVDLGKVYTEENFIEKYEYLTLKEYDKQYKKDIEELDSSPYYKDRKIQLVNQKKNYDKYRKEFISALKDFKYNKILETGRYDLTFSVFYNMKLEHKSTYTEENILDAYENAYYYVRLLLETNVFGSLDRIGVYEIECDYNDEFKSFLEQTNVKITNENIEYLENIQNRLRKDSKIFYYLKEYLGDGTYTMFISDLEFICSNDPESVDLDLEDNDNAFSR